MKEKLLVIVGPTAIGKSKLALFLAKRFQGELISADSRQVYRGMDIGTGKDLQEKVKSRKSKVKWKDKPINYYEIEGIKLWGYDLVKPDAEFNAAFFEEFAWAVIRFVWKQNKLPIIVGGTGLYIKAITEPLITVHIPPNKLLRSRLKDISVTELQERLKYINIKHFNKMNNSDKNNKRRLIRAIELGLSKSQIKEDLKLKQKKLLLKKISILKIGLTAPKPFIYKRIDRRVDKRIKQKAEQEVKRLLREGCDGTFPSVMAAMRRLIRRRISRLLIRMKERRKIRPLPDSHPL